MPTDPLPLERAVERCADAARPAPKDPPWLTARFCVLLLTQACFSLGWSGFYLLPKFLDHRFSLGPGAIGAVVAVASGGAMLSVPFVGYLLDRYDRRRFVSLGSLMVAAANLGYAQVERVDALIVLLQLLQGLGYVFAWNAAASIAADLAPPGRMGRVIGVFGAANLSMNAVAPWIGEKLAHDVGWHAPFLASAGICLVAALLARRLPSRPRAVSSPALANVASAMRAPALLRVFGGASLFAVSFSASFTLHGPFAFRSGVQAVAPFFLGFTLTALTARLVLGGVVDRFGALRVAVIAMSAYALAPLVLAALGPRHLFVAGSALGACHGVLYPAIMALGVERSDPAHRGMVMSLIHGAFNGGASIAGLVLGAVADRFSFESAFVVASVATASGAMVLGVGSFAKALVGAGSAGQGS